MSDLISIIIVNYNGKKWLKKLFDSLLAQIYKNIEIVVVDNNSADRTKEIVQEFSKKHAKPNLKLFSKGLKCSVQRNFADIKFT